MVILSYMGDSCLDILSGTWEYRYIGVQQATYRRVQKLLVRGAEGAAWQVLKRFQCIRKEGV
ncbi:MAG: hypothetical protein ACYTEQ_00920 [Planctomycetota bacterium]|jgi:hypothetical protein